MTDERTKEPRGVTNNEADRAAMLERRKRAGDVVPFSPAAALDRAIEGKNEMMTSEMLPPAAGWQLRAKRSFTSGGTFFPRGATVPLGEIERAANVAALFSDNLTWCPPGSPPGPQPRPVVAAAAPKRPSKDQVA